jgi:hypothetical protein
MVMRVLSSLVAICLFLAPRAHADELAAPPTRAASDADAQAIPGGHVYFGPTISGVMLPIGLTDQDGVGVVHTGRPDGGALVGLALSVELQRMLFIGTAEVGAAGTSSLLLRANLLGGYVLTPATIAPYVAAGLSGFSVSYGDLGDARAGPEGLGVALEAGLLMGRSNRFGRITAAATVMLPMIGRGSASPWNPWLSLGVRFQL